MKEYASANAKPEAIGKNGTGDVILCRPGCTLMRNDDIELVPIDRKRPDMLVIGWPSRLMLFSAPVGKTIEAQSSNLGIIVGTNCGVLQIAVSVQSAVSST